jgi:hypothetical protein
VGVVANEDEASVCGLRWEIIELLVNMEKDRQWWRKMNAGREK